MYRKYTGVLALLGLLSLAGGYNITSTVVDGLPEFINISPAPFVKISKGYYYIENNQKGTWYQAYLACRELGAELVSFETRKEMEAVEAVLPNNQGGLQYWTSGTDLAVHRRHVWFSNAEPLSDDLWYNGEPNDFNGIERCDIFVHNDRNQHGLNDLSCDHVQNYICEALPPKTASFVIW